MKVLTVQSCSTLCDPGDCHKVQASRSMGVPRQEHWSGLPCDPSPGIIPGSPGLLAHSLPSELPGKPTVTELKVINSDLGPKPSPAPKLPISSVLWPWSQLHFRSTFQGSDGVCWGYLHSGWTQVPGTLIRPLVCPQTGGALTFPATGPHRGGRDEGAGDDSSWEFQPSWRLPGPAQPRCLGVWVPACCLRFRAWPQTDPTSSRRPILHSTVTPCYPSGLWPVVGILGHPKKIQHLLVWGRRNPRQKNSGLCKARSGSKVGILG